MDAVAGSHIEYGLGELFAMTPNQLQAAVVSKNRVAWQITQSVLIQRLPKENLKTSLKFKKAILYT